MLDEKFELKERGWGAEARANLNFSFFRSDMLVTSYGLRTVKTT